MIALLWFFLTLLASPSKSKSRLEAENAALRHQLIVLQRRVSGRVQLTNGDRLFLVMLYRWFPSILKAITIIRLETLVRWHHADLVVVDGNPMDDAAVLRVEDKIRRVVLNGETVLDRDASRFLVGAGFSSARSSSTARG